MMPRARSFLSRTNRSAIPQYGISMFCREGTDGFPRGVDGTGCIDGAGTQPSRGVAHRSRTDFGHGIFGGGHLAARLGVFWKQDFLLEPLGRKSEEIRPNGMILACPVITAGKFAHQDSFVNLLGDRYEEQIGLVSLENQVSPDTPPTFLWHTWIDTIVPVENILLLAGAFRRNGVPLEMHILPAAIMAWHLPRQKPTAKPNR